MNHFSREIIGFSHMLVTGYHWRQLQSYIYPGKIERTDRLHYYNRNYPTKKLVLFLNGGTQFTPLDILNADSCGRRL